MNIPDGLHYTKEHEWVRVEGDAGTIGITDYAQDQLGDIVYLDLPAPGTVIVQYEKMGEIESVKAVSDLYAPVSGEVLEVNQAAIDAPELVNAEPYGRGWLIKVRLRDSGELAELIDPAGYRAFLSQLDEQSA